MQHSLGLYWGGQIAINKLNEQQKYIIELSICQKSQHQQASALSSKSDISPLNLTTLYRVLT